MEECDIDAVNDSVTIPLPTRGETSASCTSILHKLRVPTRSQTLQGSAKWKQQTSINATDPKTVSPTQRVRDFTNECLTVKEESRFAFSVERN